MGMREKRKPKDGCAGIVLLCVWRVNEVLKPEMY